MAGGFRVNGQKLDHEGDTTAQTFSIVLEFDKDTVTFHKCAADMRFELRLLSNQGLGAVSIRKTVLPGMAIPMLKIRRPNGRLIFNMEIAIRR